MNKSKKKKRGRELTFNKLLPRARHIPFISALSEGDVMLIFSLFIDEETKVQSNTARKR